jgi:hypothetical protein
MKKKEFAQGLKVMVFDEDLFIRVTEYLLKVADKKPGKLIIGTAKVPKGDGLLKLMALMQKSAAKKK